MPFLVSLSVFWIFYACGLSHGAGLVRIDMRGHALYTLLRGRTESGRHWAVPEGQLYMRIRLSLPGIMMAADLSTTGARPAALGSFFGCRLGFRVGKQLESDQNWAKIPKIDLKTASFHFFTIFQSPTPFIF